MELVAGYGAEVSRGPRPRCVDAAGARNGLRDGWAADGVPRDGGRSQEGRKPGLIHRPGFRRADEAPERGRDCRRVRTLSAVMLSSGQYAECFSLIGRAYRPGLAFQARQARLPESPEPPGQAHSMPEIEMSVQRLFLTAAGQSSADARCWQYLRDGTEAT